MTIIVSYREPDQAQNRRANRQQDPRKELDNLEKSTYDALRTWRAARAKQEGVAPYMIAHNKQIAQIVQNKIMSKSDLGNISGFGEAKVKQYGDEILQILAEQNTTSETSETKKEREEKL